MSRLLPFPSEIKVLEGTVQAAKGKVITNLSSIEHENHNNDGMGKILPMLRYCN